MKPPASLTSLDLGNLLLRCAIGGTLFVHGWIKFAGGEAFLQTVGHNWSAAIGISWNPLFWGLFVATVQTLGGVLLVLGLFTRAAALTLVFVMGVGALMVFEREGATFKDWSHPFESALTCLAIAVMGPGRAALGRLLSRKKS